MAEEETLPFMLLGCLVQTRESHLALWMLSVKVEGFPRLEIDF